MNAIDSCLLVFAKAPVPGQVKTRLEPRLGAKACAKLQQSLIDHTLATATADATLPVTLFCAPDTTHPFFRECRERYPITLRQQTGRDLGARMANALAASLTEHDKSVIIGTDCPSMGPDTIRQAFEALSHARCVLGPAEDGGYVLIGARQAAWALFADIDWGSARVLEQTRQRLTTLAWTYIELGALRDLDTEADLDHALRQPALTPLLNG